MSIPINYGNSKKIIRNMCLQWRYYEVKEKEIKAFSEWILEVGDGKVREPNHGEAAIKVSDYHIQHIFIPRGTFIGT